MKRRREIEQWEGRILEFEKFDELRGSGSRIFVPQPLATATKAGYTEEEELNLVP